MSFWGRLVKAEMANREKTGKNGDYSNVTGADSRIARQGTGRIDLGPAQCLRVGPQLGERLDPKPDCVGRVPTGR